MGQKKIEINILIKSMPGEFELAFAEKIEADTMLEALAQLPFVVNRYQQLQIEKWKKVAQWKDDDIPF